jgi:hypothetical protein
METYEMRSCTEACLACATACREAAYAWLHEPTMARLARRCFDCANQCIICCLDIRNDASLLIHSSHSCAELCELCALECSHHQDDLINRCEAACRVCADECRSVGLTLARRDTRLFC